MKGCADGGIRRLLAAVFVEVHLLDVVGYGGINKLAEGFSGGYGFADSGG